MARMQSVDAEAIKKPQERNSGSSMDAVSLTSQAAALPPTISAEEDLQQAQRRSNWRLLGLCMFFLFYLAMGATVFEAIEGPLEQTAMAKLVEQKNDFMNKYRIPGKHIKLQKLYSFTLSQTATVFTALTICRGRFGRLYDGHR